MVYAELFAMIEAEEKASEELDVDKMALMAQKILRGEDDDLAYGACVCINDLILNGGS